MKKLILISSIAILSVFSTFAQKRNCGSMQYLQALQTADPGLKARMAEYEKNIQSISSAHTGQKATTTLTIPVVFHIVYNTTAQNISDQRILDQLNVLNKDFARLNSDANKTPSAFLSVASGTTVQFCLAQRDPNGNPTNGIIRKYTTVTAFSTNDNVKYSSSGGDDAWPRGSYLNIWVCNMSNGILGYAQFPGTGLAATDGVVLLFSSVGGPTYPGTISYYNIGRTATHEVGHWLNLYHIWGDDNSACTGTDNVTDTPNQGAENYGCPVFPKLSCSNGPNGDMFMNFMDYTDDACMNMFTTGQSTRIQSALSLSPRSSLSSSLGCAPATCNAPTGLSANNLTTTSATLSWTAIGGVSGYSVQYRAVGALTWAAASASTNSISISGLTASTNYEFQIKTNCTSSLSSDFSASATFTTPATDPSCGVPSGLASSNITSNSATLSWLPITGATSYNIQYRVSSATTWTTTTSNTNSLTLSGLGASTSYQFSVQANCSNVLSAYSSSASFTTLAGGCTDPYESNNSISAAKTIAVNTSINGLISTSTDNDYFKFTTVSPNTNFLATLSNLPANYDLRIYSSTGSLLATSANTGTTNEVIRGTTSNPGTYYLRVYGKSGAFNTTRCYTLSLAASSTPFRTMGEQEINFNESLSIFPNPANNNLNINYISNEEGLLNICIIDLTGRTVLRLSKDVVNGNNSIEDIDISNLNKGIYFIEATNGSERELKRFVISR